MGPERTLTNGVVVVVVLFFFIHLLPPAAGASPLPVVFVPGYAASALQVDVARTADVTPYCQKGQSVPWRNHTLLALQHGSDCVSQYLSLTYDDHRGEHVSRSGVTVSVPHFGAVASLALGNITTRFVSHITRTLQYAVDKSFRVAAYDWRLPSGEIIRGGFYDRLKSLIENTKAANGGRPVHVLVHGTGAPLFYEFAQSFVPAAWVESHVASMISVGGMWDGERWPFAALTFATKPAILPNNPALDRTLLRGWTGVTTLLPKRSVPGDNVLVASAARNYTLPEDGAEVLKLLGLEDHAAQYLAAASRAAVLDRPPLFDVYCFHGTNVPTDSAYYWPTTDDLRSQPWRTVRSRGDGLQVTSSLSSCEVWRRGLNPRYILHSEAFPGVGNVDLLTSGSVFAAVRRAITSPRYFYL